MNSAKSRQRRSSVFESEGSSCDDEQSLVNCKEVSFSFILTSSNKLQTKESENLKKFLFKYVSLGKTFVFDTNESLSKDTIFNLNLVLKPNDFGDIIYHLLSTM